MNADLSGIRRHWRGMPTDTIAIGAPVSENQHVTDPFLDDLNKRIIEQLQRDGRMSYAALAKVVGLS